MRILKKSFIIGILVTAGVGLQTSLAHALYSPTLSRQIGIIQQHILSSQSQNGTGDVLSAIESVKDYNRLKRQAGEVSGFSGEARAAMEMITERTYQQVLSNPFDSLMMVFNFNMYNDQWISNCLRNDIWSLEALRDLVGAEMVKAYLMLDRVHGNLLEADYNYLITQLDLLRRYGADPYAEISGVGANGQPVVMTSNEYFFQTKPDGPDAMNFYTQRYFRPNETGCPEGEFEKVFQQVSNAWEVFKVLGSGRGTEWGNIWQMAQANARIRARQWIKANQLSLTIGGEDGGRIQSLIKGDGPEKFFANFQVQLKILENMVGPVTPLFSREIWQTHLAGKQTGIKAECTFYHAEDGIFRDCTDNQIEQYKECKKDKEAAEKNGIPCLRYRNIKEATTYQNQLNAQIRAELKNQEAKKEALSTFTYAITLDSIGEQNLLEMDNALRQINGVIKQGYEGVGQQGGASIPTLTKEVRFLSRNQCVNKQSAPLPDF